MQGVFEDDDNIHIVMELCAGGGLMDRVKQVCLAALQNPLYHLTKRSSACAECRHALIASSDRTPVEYNSASCSMLHVWLQSVPCFSSLACCAATRWVSS